MNKKEYEDFKLLEKELDEKRMRIYNYEKKVKRLDNLDKSIDKIKTCPNYACVELAGIDYVSFNIKDRDFCNKKLLEILENERSILVKEIDEI